MKYILVFLFSLISFFTLNSIIHNNTEIITLNYIIGEKKIALFHAIMILFTSGFLFGSIFIGFFCIKLLFLVSSLKKKIKKKKNTQKTKL